MRRTLAIAVAGTALTAAPAAAEGRLGTLPIGRYLCELPGDASGLASRPVDSMWFDIKNASRYATAAGVGTYLLTGDDVVFTRGPWNGAKFRRTSDRSLRRTDLSDALSALRCVRTGSRSGPTSR